MMKQQAVLDDEARRYPIGRFEFDGTTARAHRAATIDLLADFPSKLAELVRALTETQLEAPYRHGGWNPKQVVHHLADSHMNGFARWKLALTESAPIIKAYDESAWAKLPDGRDTDATISLQLIDAVHARWVYLIRSLPDSAFERTYIYPTKPDEPMSLDRSLALYAWHAYHHMAQIANVRAVGLS